ncbi:MAG: redoxin domain-containing protein [Acidobacteriota bacterium]
MRKLTRAILFFSMIALAATSAVNQPALAQEASTKPAPEQSDDFQKALTDGRLLVRQGRVEEAITELRRAAALRDDKCAECFQSIGQINLQLGRLKEAAVAFRQAAELKPPNEAEMYNVLGVVLYLQNEKELFEQAAVALQRAIELSKGKVVKAYYNLGFALIKAGKEQEGVAALKTYLELDPASSDASQARAVIANTKMVDARVAPSFAVKSHTGGELSLEKLRGKVVLLDFWASWCLPCRRDIPEIKTILKKFGGEQFVMIGINLDSNRPEFDAYMKEEGITWLQYYDGLGWRNKVSQLYGVYAIPHTVLIDQDGVIKAAGLRGEELSEKIGELLKKLHEQKSETRSN